MSAAANSSNSAGLHVVLGAGQIGRPLIAALAAAGHRVRVVTRNHPDMLPTGVEHHSADLRADAAADAAVRACTDADVIYHVAGAPYAQWSQTLPAIMDSAIRAATASGAHLVYLDNLYAFGAPTGPITESSPSNPIESKGRLRLDLTERLLGAAERGNVRAVSVAHATDFFGPLVTSSTPQALVLDPIAAGKRARWPFDLDQPHALAYTPDIVSALIAVGALKAEGSDRWIIPTDTALTGRAFAAAAGRAQGQAEATPAVLTRFMLKSAGLFSANARALACLAHQYDRPFVVDGTRARERLGVRPTPIEQALARPSAAPPAWSATL
jgi:nucleoside-diphosphate-sugar epimerase